MKHLLIILFLGISLQMTAQNTFQVCNLPLNIDDELKAESLETVVKRKAEIVYRAEKKPFSQDPIGLGSTTLQFARAQGTKELIDTKGHAFLNTMNLAYDQHRPVTISPDMVWLTIIQGVGIHLNKEIASLSEKAFYVKRDDFSMKANADKWNTVFVETNGQIKNLLGNEFHAYLFKRFSTSTWNTSAANNIAIVDDSGEVFSLVQTTACGIPSFTIEGTVKDWEKIEKAAVELDGFELEWWTEYLLPVLEEFTAAAGGNPNISFWRDFYKNSDDGSGNELITGHILQLFPYKKAGKAYKMNEMIGRKPGDDSYSRIVYPDGREEMYKPIFSTANVPKGYGATLLELEHKGRVYDMKLMSGFIGCVEDSETKGLKPVIASWVMNEGHTSKPTRAVEKVEVEEEKEPEQTKPDIKEINIDDKESDVGDTLDDTKANPSTTAPPVGGLGGPKKSSSQTIKVPLETPRKKPTPR